MSAPSVTEPVNEILDSYISFAMERYTAAIHRYTRIYRDLQSKMRSFSYIEAFQARLREEEEENGNTQHGEPVGAAQRMEEVPLATVDPVERCPRQEFLPIDRDGRRGTLPVPCPPIAKRARGMPVDISGTLSRLVNTDNEEARKVAPELYDGMDEMVAQGLAAMPSDRFQGKGSSSKGDAAQRESTQTEGASSRGGMRQQEEASLRGGTGEGPPLPGGSDPDAGARFEGS